MQINNTKQHKRLKEFTSIESQYIEDEWHHVCLTVLDLVPTKKTRYNDLDFYFTFNDIKLIIEIYGIKPPKYHWYWLEVERRKDATNEIDIIENNDEAQISFELSSDSNSNIGEEELEYSVEYIY